MVVITVSGPPGSGKSTIAKFLSKRFRLNYYSIGSYFRMKAKEAGMSIEAFTKSASKEFHIKADTSVDDVSKRGKVVIDARLAAHMASKADFRVFITAPPEVRAMRISKREGISKELALSNLTLRGQSEKKAYLDVYNIDIENLNVYDLVLNTAYLSIKDVQEVVEMIIKRALKL